MTTLRSKLTTSGNSRAVRLPKALLELSNLSDVVELEASNGQIIIRSAHNPREGWEEAIRRDIELNGSTDSVDKWGNLTQQMETATSDGLDDLGPWQ